MNRSSHFRHSSHHLHAERFQVLVRYLIWFSLGVVAQIPTKGVALQMVSNGVNEDGMDQTSDAHARTDFDHETTIRL
jgi:hypothetical protein